MVDVTIPELLQRRGWTAYQLAKRSDGRISMSAAYRLATGKWRFLTRDQLEAVCAVLGCEPGELFVRRHAKRRSAVAR